MNVIEVSHKISNDILSTLKNLDPGKRDYVIKKASNKFAEELKSILSNKNLSSSNNSDDVSEKYYIIKAVDKEGKNLSVKIRSEEKDQYFLSENPPENYALFTQKSAKEFMTNLQKEMVDCEFYLQELNSDNYF